MGKYVLNQPDRSFNYWRLFSLVMIFITIISVMLAFYCSRPLHCEQIYSSDNKNYCIVEIYE